MKTALKKGVFTYSGVFLLSLPSILYIVFYGTVRWSDPEFYLSFVEYYRQGFFVFDAKPLIFYFIYDFLFSFVDYFNLSKYYILILIDVVFIISIIALAYSFYFLLKYLKLPYYLIYSILFSSIFFIPIVALWQSFSPHILFLIVLNFTTLFFFKLFAKSEFKKWDVLLSGIILAFLIQLNPFISPILVIPVFYMYYRRKTVFNFFILQFFFILGFLIPFCIVIISTSWEYFSYYYSKSINRASGYTIGDALKDFYVPIGIIMVISSIFFLKTKSIKYRLFILLSFFSAIIPFFLKLKWVQYSSYWLYSLFVLLPIFIDIFFKNSKTKKSMYMVFSVVLILATCSYIYKGKASIFYSFMGYNRVFEKNDKYILNMYLYDETKNKKIMNDIFTSSRWMRHGDSLYKDFVFNYDFIIAEEHIEYNHRNKEKFFVLPYKLRVKKDIYEKYIKGKDLRKLLEDSLNKNIRYFSIYHFLSHWIRNKYLKG